ncbi:MAG: DJ-1/PfpI family protein [Oscillospiraceae bacterium]|nr:DJ-1/PfpI family protein [Oscillospiraceae bacterium]
MVYVLLAQGFEEIEAVFPIDVLRRCGVVVCTVAVGSAEESEFVTGSNGITIKADVLLGDVDLQAVTTKAAMLILPGGPGRANVAKNGIAMDLIASCHDSGVPIAAICGAAELLDGAVLEVRKYTCYPSLESGIKSGEFVDEQVVIDGNLITAQAAGSSQEFAFAIAEKLVGKAKADEIRGRMYCL